MFVKADSNDADALTQIALKSKAFWGYSKEQLESWREDLTILPETFNDWSGFKYLYEDEIAGFYLLNRINSRTCVLEFLFVLPKFMGKDMGRQLLEHALENCSTNSCEVLNVLSDPHAELFYSKYGFKTISIKESSVPGRFLPEMEIEFPENS
jgi:N-acetylglutamate synthase-like GNAT family acetyltransferase